MTERPPNLLEEDSESSDDIPDPTIEPEGGTVFGEDFFITADSLAQPLSESSGTGSVRGTDPKPENTPVPGLGLINDGVIYGDTETYD